MTNYLNASASSYPDRTAVSGVCGYWTLSSIASDSRGAWNVYYDGYAYGIGVDVNNDGSYGVRPVINLSI